MAVRGSTGAIDLGACLSVGRMGATNPGAGTEEPSGLPFKEAKSQLVDQFEKAYLVKLLERNDGNISRAAREAQIERAYLQRLVRKHELNGKE